MPLPDPTGWAPQQLLNGIQTGGYQIPASALPYLSAEQIQMLGGAQQQNPVDAFIASLPPEIQSSPTQILQAAGSNPSLAQAVAEKFGLNAGSMTFENPYRNSFSDFALQAAKEVLIPWGAATGAMALTGAGAGGAAAAAPAAAPAAGSGALTGVALPAGVAPTGAVVSGLGPSIPAAAGGAAVGPLAGAATGGFGNFLSKYGDYIVPAINGLAGAYASGKAADAETAALQAGIDEQRRQYDTTRADLQPWLTAGQGALGKLNDPTTNFMASPDYAFRRSEGERDIGNSFAARGGAVSGNALRALTEYNSSLASGEYGDWWNRQAGLAGVGQTTGTQLGQLGANSASNVGNYLAGQGQSRASGVLGKYGALAGAGSDIYRNYLYRRAA